MSGSVIVILLRPSMLQLPLAATTNTASSNSLTRTTRTRTVPQLPLCDNDSYIGNDIDGNTAGTKATTIVDVHDATAKHE